LFGNSDLAVLEPADPDRYSNRAGRGFLDMAVGKIAHRFPGLENAAVGRLVADLVVDGKSSDPDIPERDFRLARFAEGDLLTSPFPYVGAGEMR
jgi:hypothetical protein